MGGGGGENLSLTWGGGWDFTEKPTTPLVIEKKTG